MSNITEKLEQSTFCSDLFGSVSDPAAIAGKIQKTDGTELNVEKRKVNVVSRRKYKQNTNN